MNIQQLMKYLGRKEIDDNYEANRRSIISMIHNKYKNYVDKYEVTVKKEQYFTKIFLRGTAVAILSSDADTNTVREAIHIAVNAAAAVETGIIERIKRGK